MGSIKTIAIAFAISFCTLVFITNAKVRCEIFEVLNHKIGKSKIKIYNLFTTLILLIMILYSFHLLDKSKIIVSLIERKSAIQAEKNIPKNEVDE